MLAEFLLSFFQFKSANFLFPLAIHRGKEEGDENSGKNLRSIDFRFLHINQKVTISRWPHKKSGEMEEILHAISQNGRVLAHSPERENLHLGAAFFGEKSQIVWSCVQSRAWQSRKCGRKIVWKWAKEDQKETFPGSQNLFFQGREGIEPKSWGDEAKNIRELLFRKKADNKSPKLLKAKNGYNFSDKREN